MSKALIAMSGGVDSSVAAALTQRAGHECVGVTMQLFEGESGCCSLSDVEDARSVAMRLGFDHFVLNFKNDFEREVISRFISEYESGATPNPCIDCNRYIKFSALYRRAAVLECGLLVTGHYARIEKSGDRYLLKKGTDLSKDQSYVLCFMTQEELARTSFPLGTLTKAEVREIAAESGFLNARKKDSQDICFVPDGDYASFIERRTGKRYPEGDFVDVNGGVLGRHRGMIRYTVGQRKGLGLSLPEPLYVKEKDVEHNRVVLARDCELYSSAFTVRDVNWIATEAPPERFRASVRTRYKAKEAPATLTLTEGGVLVKFDEPQRAITRGQTAVFYDEDTVIGGGKIEL